MYCVFIARTSSGVENLNIISDTGVADKLPHNCIVEGSIAKSSEGLFIVLIFLWCFQHLFCGFLGHCLIIKKFCTG